MSKDKPPKTCQDCQHYEAIDKNKGYCNRYPPTAGAAGAIKRVKTKQDTKACGEFKK